jgi:hypothetical protein
MTEEYRMLSLLVRRGAHALMDTVLSTELRRGNLGTAAGGEAHVTAVLYAPACSAKRPGPTVLHGRLSILPWLRAGHKEF